MPEIKMEERIKMEMRGRKAEEITQLNIDNCHSSQQIEGITDDFKTLENLSAINCGLQSLKGFPFLSSLKKIDFSDNKLSNGLEFLAGCKNLTHINISGNSFSNVKAFEPLKDFANLKSLDAFGCPIMDEPEFREKVFEILPNLKYLDGFDKDDNECSSSEFSSDSDDAYGLEYLQTSKAVQDEDETDDFDPNVDDDDDEDDDIDEEDLDDEEDDEGEGANKSDSAPSANQGKASAEEAKGTKRKLED